MNSKTVFVVNKDNQVKKKTFTLNANTSKGKNFMQYKQQVYNFLNYTVQKYYHSSMLEVSTTGTKGKNLSAFRLKYREEKTGKLYPVENVFQSGKYFEKSGNLDYLLDLSPKQAKQGVSKIQRKEKIIKFVAFGQDYKTTPMTLFYNWIYCNALYQHKLLLKLVQQYRVFSDINFINGINCQAESCAIMVALSNKGILDQAMKSINNFETLVYKDKIIE